MIKKRIYLKLFLLLIFCLIFLIGFYFLKEKNFEAKDTRVLIESPSPIIVLTPEKKEEEKESEKIPESYKIENVPFTSQAPYGKWDFDHKEACEEAAILMAHFFYQQKSLNPEIADREIMGMVNYQKKNWQGHFDLEAEEIARLAREYYNYQNPRVIYDISTEDIKKEVAKKNPVILPTAGRLLKNPYYRSPGPLYHALVVIGYSKDSFIVHDPGTKRGENYVYPVSIIENAMHEWNKGDVLNGRRAMILLK